MAHSAGQSSFFPNISAIGCGESGFYSALLIVDCAVFHRCGRLARPIHETEVPGLLGGDAFSVM